MVTNGIIWGVVTFLEQPHDYRYVLYDTNGNEVSDRSGEHRVFHSDETNEWGYKIVEEATSPDSPVPVILKLRYEGGDLIFGPATSDWGDVNQVRVDVDLGDGYETFGAAKLDSTYTVDQGEALSIDVDTQELLIDYSAGSDSLGTFPSSLTGFLNTFVEFTNKVENVNSWVFEMETDTGDLHDKVVKTHTGADLWQVQSNKLTWTGSDIEWKKTVTGFTASSVRVLGNIGDRTVRVGEASVSGTLSAGDIPKVQSGNLTLSA